MRIYSDNIDKFIDGMILKMKLWDTACQTNEICRKRVKIIEERHKITNLSLSGGLRGVFLKLKEE